LFVTLPGRIGTTRGCTFPLMGSILGCRADLDFDVDIYEHGICCLKTATKQFDNLQKSYLVVLFLG
jgi:hypothetical protein